MIAGMELEMKYVVILGDGMADRPIPSLNGKTPLEAANKPAIDALAKKGEMGMVQTVPDGIAPGSDVANLSVLGYNPLKFYYALFSYFVATIGILFYSQGIHLIHNFYNYLCNAAGNSFNQFRY